MSDRERRDVARRAESRRRRRLSEPTRSRANDMQLLSGWQGDNAGGTSVPANVTCVPPYAPAAPRRRSHTTTCKTPVLAGVTGQILGRIINRSGLDAAPLNVMGNPVPVFPGRPDATTRGDMLTIHTHETVQRRHVDRGRDACRTATGSTAAAATFARARAGDDAAGRVCLKNGFDATKLYQLVYTVERPVRARRRHGGVPRRAVVLPLRGGRRFRHAESASPARSPRRSCAASRSRAISCASTSSSA